MGEVTCQTEAGGQASNGGKKRGWRGQQGCTATQTASQAPEAPRSDAAPGPAPALTLGGWGRTLLSPSPAERSKAPPLPRRGPLPRPRLSPLPPPRGRGEGPAARPAPPPPRAAVTSRPRREGRRRAHHFLGASRPRGLTDDWRAVDGGERPADRRGAARGGGAWGARPPALGAPGPMAGPAPPAADELLGPARRLYSRWAGQGRRWGRAGPRGDRAAGAAGGGIGRPGTKAAASAQRGGDAPPSGAGGGWGRGVGRRVRGEGVGGCGRWASHGPRPREPGH